jgi:pimeloyl-ACP methyl ester carboxylesterase
MPFFKFQNKNIHYKTEGSGEVVVLLHGFLENGSMWDEIALEISKFQQVVRIDFPGFGASEELGKDYSIEDLANCTHQVLTELKIDKYTLIGHSMGGYVALEFCKLLPNQVNHLILFHSTAKADTDSKKKDRDRAIKAVFEKKKVYLKTVIPLLFPEQLQKSCTEYIQKMITEANILAPKGITTAISAMKNRNDNSELVQSLNCKKTYIAGNLDPLLPIENLKIEAIANGADFIGIENAGHMSHWENPAAVIRELKNILT